MPSNNCVLHRLLNLIHTSRKFEIILNGNSKKLKVILCQINLQFRQLRTSSSVVLYHFLFNLQLHGQHSELILLVVLGEGASSCSPDSRRDPFHPSKEFGNDV